MERDCVQIPWLPLDVLSWSVGLFLLSLILLGMPHGALDHLVYFRLKDQSITLPSLGLFIIIYLLLGSTLVLFWMTVPLVAVGGLILLTWAHWGDGDTTYERHLGNSVPSTFLYWRGALPMIVPLFTNPDHYAQVLSGAVRIAGGSESFVFLQDTRVTMGVFIGLVVLGIAHWINVLKSSEIYPVASWFRQDIGLIALFMLLPPLASIGVYFMFWHSLRHIRVMSELLGKPIKRRDASISWLAFYRAAAPFTMLGIMFVVGQYVWALQWTSDMLSMVGSYLCILWGLTGPHAVICYMIRKKNSKK
ncbi:MAG: Brp/Blh family beta-carotene 15,15'-dioxygenase [Verrucomicrobiota bacterium]